MRNLSTYITESAKVISQCTSVKKDDFFKWLAKDIKKSMGNARGFNYGLYITTDKRDGEYETVVLMPKVGKYYSMYLPGNRDNSDFIASSIADYLMGHYKELQSLLGREIYFKRHRMGGDIFISSIFVHKPYNAKEQYIIDNLHIGEYSIAKGTQSNESGFFYNDDFIKEMIPLIKKWNKEDRKLRADVNEDTYILTIYDDKTNERLHSVELEQYFS